MKKIFLFCLFYCFIPKMIFTQSTCITGAMSIYDKCGSPPGGQGCLGGCNLSEFSWFGSMCNGTAKAGDCNNGSKSLTSTFTIPASCTATLSARFSNRCNGNGNGCSSCGACSSGCGSSGMDNGDNLNVGGNSPSPVYTNSTSVGGSPTTNTTTNASGYTLTATGSSNSGIILQYAQTGGSMFVSMTANRSDEIITFTLDIQSGCDCANVLPVDIFAFDATPKNGVIELKWYTKNEQHLSHYKIDKSTDGINFYNIAKIPSENSYTEKIYTATDDNPTVGITYYKLTPVNKSGIDEQYIIRDVLYQLSYQPFSYSLQDEELVLQFEAFDVPTNFSIKDMNGKTICQIPEIKEHQYKLNTQSWSKGVYVGILQNRYQTYVYKIIIL